MFVCFKKSILLHHITKGQDWNCQRNTYTQVPSEGPNRTKNEIQTWLALNEVAEDKISKWVWGFTCH